MTIIMSHATSIPPGKLEQELTAIDAGVLKDIPAKTAITINGTPMTGAQIDSKLKGYIETIQAADAAKQSYVAAVNARRAITLEARDFYLQLKKSIVAFFGAQSPQLDDFGLKPAKAAARNSHQDVLAAAKRTLTRAARGTKGKKQKEAINPMVGTPLVTVGPDGKPVITAPNVVNPTVAGGNGPASESSPATGSPQNGAPTPAPAGGATGGTPGSGTPGSNA